MTTPSGSITCVAAVRDSTIKNLGTDMGSSQTYLCMPCPKAGKFVLQFQNMSSSAPVFSILSGTGLHANQGNKSITCVAATVSPVVMGPFSTSRFKSVSGSNAFINISFPTVCTTGSLWGIALP